MKNTIQARLQLLREKHELALQEREKQAEKFKTDPEMVRLIRQEMVSIREVITAAKKPNPEIIDTFYGPGLQLPAGGCILLY